MGKAINKDYNLLESFKKGNDVAFYQLYGPYADTLYSYGVHSSGDVSFVKDCIHDLFLDLYSYKNRLSETDNVQFYSLRCLRRKIHKEQVKTIPIIFGDNLASSHVNQVLPYEEKTVLNGNIKNNKVMQ